MTTWVNGQISLRKIDQDADSVEIAISCERDIPPGVRSIVGPVPFLRLQSFVDALREQAKAHGVEIR